MKEGLAVATSRHFENIRLLVSLYKEIKGNRDGEFPDVEKGFIFNKKLRNDVAASSSQRLIPSMPFRPRWRVMR